MNNKTTYFQKNKERLLQKAKKYYENNKERLQEQARNKDRELSINEKDKQREYGRKRYQNMSEENKQRLKDYQKIIVKQKHEHKFFFIFFTQYILLDI